MSTTTRPPAQQKTPKKTTHKATDSTGDRQPKSQAVKSHQPNITGQQVVDFINQNPDFLMHNPQLVAEILLPFSGDPVPLMQHQIRVLREKNKALEAHIGLITTTAMENEALLDNTIALALSLLETHELVQLIHKLEQGLTDIFSVQAAHLYLFDTMFHELPPANQFFQKTSPQFAQKILGQATNPKHIITGPQRPESLEFLFPEAHTVGSAAVVPLHFHAPIGLLAIGHSNSLHFRPDQDHLFLKFLQEVISRVFFGAAANVATSV